MSLPRVLVLVLAFGVLLAVVLGMVASSTTPDQLGPYPAGDGDDVVVAPRAIR